VKSIRADGPSFSCNCSSQNLRSLRKQLISYNPVQVR
jgi:hypothetical protein